MNARKIFGLLSTTLWLFGYVPYVLGFYGLDLWGHYITPTQPEKATWFIFLLLDTVVLVGMYTKRAFNWQIVIATIMALGIWVYSCFYGVPGWTVLDSVCVAIGMLGLVLWYLNRDANWGIVINTIGLVVGVIPTVVSVWHDPTHETIYGWIFGLTSCVILITITKPRTVANLTQPIGFLITEASVVAALLMKGALQW